MQEHSQQTADLIRQHTDYESEVGKMHAWLVDHCANGDIKDKDGYPIAPVTFYTLNRMRQCYDKFDDGRIDDVTGKRTIWPMSPPSGYEKRQLDIYTELRLMYANRNDEPAPRVGPSFFLIVAILVPAVMFGIVYLAWLAFGHGGK